METGQRHFGAIVAQPGGAFGPKLPANWQTRDVSRSQTVAESVSQRTETAINTRNFAVFIYESSNFCQIRANSRERAGKEQAFSGFLQASPCESAI